MALIIKADMPKGCYWYDIEGNYEKENVHYCDYLFLCHNCTKGSRPDHCPILGEVPDKHGRLIDADAFKKSLIEARYADNPNKEKTYNKALDILFDAPTIVEAST